MHLFPLALSHFFLPLFAHAPTRARAVEDTAILDASMDIITSRKVRDKMKLGHSVEQLVGEKINDYVQIHHLGQKVT